MLSAQLIFLQTGANDGLFLYCIWYCSNWSYTPAITISINSGEGASEGDVFEK